MNKELPFGISATYWKISSVNISLKKNYIDMSDNEPTHNEIEVVLFGYIDKDKRDENKLNVCSETFMVSIPCGVNINEEIRPLLYEAIKLNPEWYSAISV